MCAAEERAQITCKRFGETYPCACSGRCNVEIDQKPSLLKGEGNSRASRHLKREMERGSLSEQPAPVMTRTVLYRVSVY
jgi:hypothetical protein